jgi:hypothetical protein
MVPQSLYLLLLSELSLTPLLLMLLYLSLLQCCESPSFLLFKISVMFRLHSCLGFEEAVCSHVAGSCRVPVGLEEAVHFCRKKSVFFKKRI